MNKTLAEILKKTTVIIFTIIAGIGVYLFNAQTIVGNPLPMPFGVGAAIVLSGSMEPTLSVNDLIIVKEQESYEVGDVVVFQDGKHMVIHRIIEMNGDTVQTQGDANNAPDVPIDGASIKGKLAICIPKAGMIVQVLKTPLGIIAILAIAILLMELSYRRDKSQENEELKAIKEEIRQLREELGEDEE